IPVPDPIHDPPPAEASAIIPMHPMPTTPEADIVLVKTCDVAVPSRICRNRRGAHESHDGEEQYDHREALQGSEALTETNLPEGPRLLSGRAFGQIGLLLRQGHGVVIGGKRGLLCRR